MKQKKILVWSTSSVGYVGSYVGLYSLWYAGYDQSSFHWFDDKKEWLQIDKLGHFQTAYNLSANVLNPMFRWAGYTPRKAALYGMGYAFLYQATIEVFDGFSVGWGASWSDLLADGLGAGMAGAQDYYWNEQRIQIKYSSFLKSYKNYPQPVQDRARYLFGTSLPERTLKDYNANTFWMSFNLNAFGIKKSPRWLNVAFGYGAENLFDADENIWSSNGVNYNYLNIKPYRQYFMSLDVDFTKLPINKKWYKKIAPVLNVVKLPFPTLELANKKIIFHPVYF